MTVSVSEFEEHITWKQAFCNVCGWRSSRSRHLDLSAVAEHEARCARWQKAGIRPVWREEFPVVGRTCEREVNHLERVADGALISLHEMSRPVHDIEGYRTGQEYYLELRLELNGDYMHPIEKYEVEVGWMDNPPWLEHTEEVTDA